MLEVSWCRLDPKQRTLLQQYSLVSTKCQPLPAFRSQVDLVVGIVQINLCKAVSTSQVPHEVLRNWYGLVMSLQLEINAYWITPANLDLGYFQSWTDCLSYWNHGGSIGTEVSGFHAPFLVPSLKASFRSSMIAKETGLDLQKMDLASGLKFTSKSKNRGIPTLAWTNLEILGTTICRHSAMNQLVIPRSAVPQRNSLVTPCVPWCVQWGQWVLAKHVYQVGSVECRALT